MAASAGAHGSHVSVRCDTVACLPSTTSRVMKSVAILLLLCQLVHSAEQSAPQFRRLPTSLVWFLGELHLSHFSQRLVDGAFPCLFVASELSYGFVHCFRVRERVPIRLAVRCHTVDLRQLVNVLL